MKKHLYNLSAYLNENPSVNKSNIDRFEPYDNIVDYSHVKHDFGEYKSLNDFNQQSGDKDYQYNKYKNRRNGNDYMGLYNAYPVEKHNKSEEKVICAQDLFDINKSHRKYHKLVEEPCTNEKYTGKHPEYIKPRKVMEKLAKKAKINTKYQKNDANNMDKLDSLIRNTDWNKTKRVKKHHYAYQDINSSSVECNQHLDTVPKCIDIFDRYKCVIPEEKVKVKYVTKTIVYSSVLTNTTSVTVTVTSNICSTQETTSCITEIINVPCSTITRKVRSKTTITSTEAPTVTYMLTKLYKETVTIDTTSCETEKITEECKPTTCDAVVTTLCQVEYS